MNLPKLDKQKFFEGFKKFLPFMFLEMAIFAGILALDLCLKDYLFDLFIKNGGNDISVIENFLTITFVKNTASGLGLFRNLGATGLSVIMCIAASAIIIYLNVSHKQSEWLRIPLIFMAAGGIGNVVDRIALTYVRDFFRFEFSFFPYVFNVADIFVTIGAFWLIIYLIVELAREGKKNKQVYEKQQTENSGKVSSNVVNVENTIEITTLGVGDEFLDKDFQQYNNISEDLKTVDSTKTDKDKTEEILEKDEVQLSKLDKENKENIITATEKSFSKDSDNLEK